jgi:predicted HTH domain antitoxin
MKAFQIEYPESWTASSGSSSELFESEARMALSMKLFEMGRLTSGQAAQLAGVSRMAFLFSCPQWNVPAVNWDKESARPGLVAKRPVSCVVHFSSNVRTARGPRTTMRAPRRFATSW